MREKVIEEGTIDAAVEGILRQLGITTSRENVIYFDGWDGLGASAVLRAVAQRLQLKEAGRPPELEFDRVIHVDCSMWKNTRALQRKIAKQLELPNHVMEMFDRQEEEDDFNGVTDDSSRVEIADVATKIFQCTKDRRFLLVLQNGSDEEIDMTRIGLPLHEHVKNKVIWTFQGRFRMDPRMRDKVMKSNTTHLLLSASCCDEDPQKIWYYLLHHEATEIASKLDIDASTVADCFLYTWILHCNGRHPVAGTDDLPAHACNYWICDGLLQRVGGGGSIDEEAWRVGDALQGEMRLDMDYYRHELPPCLVRPAESTPHWASPAYGCVPLPSGVIPSGLFTRFDQLCVLKLSRCSFSFSSPPFHCCHILRFLGLHHCQDLGSRAAEDVEDSTTRPWACLWVLDLRYTDCELILSPRVMDLMTQLRELNVMGAEKWDMRHMRGRLPNIRKLRVTRSTCCGLDDSNLFSGMKSIELFQFSGNHITHGLSGPAGSSSLETVIVDGCHGLKSICLRGCQQLKKVLLKGYLPGLKELDLSGTRVKILDLGHLEAPFLMRLILLGCKKLAAIKWPSRTIRIDVLSIDTTSTSGSADGREAHPHGEERHKEEFFDRSGWKISVGDARLLTSLPCAIPLVCDLYPRIHIDVCPAAALGTSAGSSNVEGEMVMWDCPGIPSYWGPKWYVKVRYDALVLPLEIYDVATSLHLYDSSSSITHVPWQGSAWNMLQWCRVERCPNLLTLFPCAPSVSDGTIRFRNLETFWGSQLLMARYIWGHDALDDIDCQNMELLHLDNCPRLIHALPLSMDKDGIPKYDLETLEIVSCGDLREVFFSSSLPAAEDTVEFPRLKRIHLHQLPMLQHICRRRMHAPNLQTIKIRGCRSLKRLPFIGNYSNPPMVDCDMEWWDRLEWDGVEAGHHPSLYQL